MDRLCMENCFIPKDIIAIEQAGTEMGLTMIQTFYSLPQVRTEKVNSQPASQTRQRFPAKQNKTSNHSNSRKRKEQTPPVYASPPGILLPKDIPPICTEPKFRA